MCHTIWWPLQRILQGTNIYAWLKDVIFISLEDVSGFSDGVALGTYGVVDLGFPSVVSLCVTGLVSFWV